MLVAVVARGVTVLTVDLAGGWARVLPRSIGPRCGRRKIERTMLRRVGEGPCAGRRWVRFEWEGI